MKKLAVVSFGLPRKSKKINVLVKPDTTINCKSGGHQTAGTESVLIGVAGRWDVPTTFNVLWLTD